MKKNLECKEYVVYGLHTVLGVLKNQPFRAKKLFIARKDMDEIKNLAIEQKIHYELVDRHYIEKKFNLSSDAQGLALLCSPYTYLTADEILYKKPKLLILLDELQDSINLGRIARLALSFGADALVICKNNSAKVSPMAEKAAVGALSIVPVVEVGNLSSFIEKLKKINFFIYGADEHGSVDINRLDFADKIAVIIGQEGEGLRSLTKKNCDLLVKIPMKNPNICLNAADAALVFLYQISIN